MKEAIASLQSSDGWQRWLATRRHFHTYSFGNQLLIATQRPEATRVAGFRAWLGLGYCVRKGECSIRISAPVPPSKKALEKWRREGSDPSRRPRPTSASSRSSTAHRSSRSRGWNGQVTEGRPKAELATQAKLLQQARKSGNPI
jgi:hypothetical protein